MWWERASRVRCMHRVPRARGAVPRPLKLLVRCRMRVPLAVAAFAWALLLQASAHAEIPLAERFAHAKAVVFVRVIESTFLQSDSLFEYPSEFYTATLEVRHSWKGPLSPGASIAVRTPKFCGGLCFWYPFRVGEEVVVLVNHSGDPSSLTALDEVIDRALVKDAISVLDALATKSGT
jgi:hypothetical protein